VKTLLTGASGFLGGWIARTLNPVPGDLRVLARPTSDLSALDDLPLDRIEGDLLDIDSLRRALDGVEQVIHTAGRIQFKRRAGADIYRLNYEGTTNLFQAALEARVERVLYTGSIFGIGYATDPEHPMDETGTFNAPHLLDIPYVRAKHDAEQAAEEYLQRGLLLVRLYPGLCLGAGDHNRSSSGAIDAWLHGGLPATISGGGICLMDVRDAAAAHVAALKSGKVGTKYLATGHNVTLPALFDQLAVIAGRRPPPLRLPVGIGARLARLVETLGVFPALDEAQARLMGHYWWYDSSRAEQELGVQFRPLEETLRWTVAWLTENYLHRRESL
jgi:dihydroflavonol-4-reductase